MQNTDRLQPSQATIGIITALSEEYAAVISVFGCEDETSVPSPSGAGCTYRLARVGKHVVAVAMMGDMANNIAAIRATNLRSHCPNVTDIVMVGIAGAVPNLDKVDDHVRLGDIVVVDRKGVIQYDLGKDTLVDSREEHETRNPPRPPSAAFLETAKRLEANEKLGIYLWDSIIDENIRRLDNRWKRPPAKTDVIKDSPDEPEPTIHPRDPKRQRRANKPRVFHGPIGSANILLKNYTRRDSLRDEFQIKAIEMEGSGIADSTWFDGIGYFVVRGTCDYCNGNKGDSWHYYAALIAAAYARVLIESLPAPSRSDDGKPNLPDSKTVTCMQINTANVQIVGDLNVNNPGMANVKLSPQSIISFTEDIDSKLNIAINYPNTHVISSEQHADKDAGINLVKDHISRLINDIDDCLVVFDYDKACKLADNAYDSFCTNIDIISDELSLKLLLVLADVETVVARNGLIVMSEIPDLSRARLYLMKTIEFDVSHRHQSTISALHEYLNYLTSGVSKGTHKALAALAGKTDNESILRRLQILIDADRITEAADLIRYRIPDKRWCDLAIATLVMNNELSPAKRTLDWAKSNDSVDGWHRCLLRYGEAGIDYISKTHGSILPTPGSLTPDELLLLSDVCSAIQQLTNFIIAKQRIENELESKAIQVALYLAYLQQDHQNTDSLSLLLATRNPIPIMLANFALWRGHIIPSNLPERLRNEHGSSFECRLMAARIDGVLLSNGIDAFRSAMQLMDDVSSADERKNLFGALVEIADICGDNERSEVQRVAKILLRDDTTTIRLSEASTLLSEGKTTEAGVILGELHDETNLIWQQIYANYLLQQGNGIEALKHFQLANDHMHHPDIYRMIARTAYRYDQYDVATNALEQLLLLQPNDVQAHTNVSAIYLHNKDYQSALSHLRALKELEPGNIDHSLNYAACLARSGDTEEAIEEYDVICKLPNPPLQAILGRVNLMRSSRTTKEAFNSLIEYKDRYWDEPAFLYELFSLGFASQNEDLAHEALTRIQQLQEDGRVGPEAVRFMDIESVQELLHQNKEHLDKVHEQVLLGRLPWTMAEMMAKRVPYLGWMIRTQPLDWLADDPMTRAVYAVYATNGFGLKTIDDHLSLSPIPLPKQASDVVIDISSLITLHQLKLLGITAKYFNKIFVPSIFIAQSIENSGRLVFHQLSQKTALEQIQHAIDAERLSIRNGDNDMPIIDEYAEDHTDTRMYSLREVSTVLHENGFINDQQNHRLLVVTHVVTDLASDRKKLVTGQNVVFDLTTLKTIVNENLLDPILKAFCVCISRNDYTQMMYDLRYLIAIENVQKWHTNLWEQVRDEPRYIPLGHPTSEGFRDEFQLSGFASYLLADLKKLPLYADDRVLQTITCNMQHDPCASFGTSELIVAMGNANLITQDDVAIALKKLIDWRYRFIVIPATVLKTMVDQYMQVPPGQPLKDVARYVQDCMRDQGLLIGEEPTQPPSSIGLKNYLAWIDSVVQFVMMVWKDTNFTIESATKLTSWALTEFVPMLPVGIDQSRRSTVAQLLPQIVINTVLLNSCSISDIERAGIAIRTVSELMGVDNLTEYLCTVTGVIDGK
ncbi:MAG: phosphorylase family protein [Armatimonadota bacterium]